MGGSCSWRRGAWGTRYDGPLFAWTSPLYFSRGLAFLVVLLSGPGAPAIPHSPYHLIVTTESDAGYVFTTLR